MPPGATSNRRSATDDVLTGTSAVPDVSQAVPYLVKKGAEESDVISVAYVQRVLMTMGRLKPSGIELANWATAIAYLVGELELDASVNKIAMAVKAQLEGTTERLSRLAEKTEVNVTDAMRVVEELTEVAKQTTADVGKLSDEAESQLQKVITDIKKTTADTITNTVASSVVTSYRDVLASQAKQPQSPHLPPPKNATELQLRNRLATKDCQILVDFPTREQGIAATKSISQQSVLDKAKDAWKSIREAEPEGSQDVPEEMGIRVTKVLDNGGVLIETTTSACAEWLQTPERARKFCDSFFPGCYFQPRNFDLVIEFAPVSLDLNRDLVDLAVENGFDEDAFASAMWIKPPNQRKAGQRLAFFILRCKQGKVANKILLSGITWRGDHLRAKRNAKEPSRCYRCQRYNHRAAQCNAEKVACGICGGEHRTTECQNQHTKWCVSCSSNSHSSNDRECPTFLRRCDAYDKRYPENQLPFFPTEEEWTWAPEPQRFVFVSAPSVNHPRRADREGPPPMRQGTLPFHPTNKTPRNRPQSHQQPPPLHGANLTPRPPHRLRNRDAWMHQGMHQIPEDNEELPDIDLPYDHSQSWAGSPHPNHNHNQNHRNQTPTPRGGLPPSQR